MIAFDSPRIVWNRIVGNDASGIRRKGLIHNKDNGNNAGQALGQQGEKHPVEWKKYVVGGIFLLLALLLLAAIILFKNN